MALQNPQCTHLRRMASASSPSRRSREFRAQRGLHVRSSKIRVQSPGVENAIRVEGALEGAVYAHQASSPSGANAPADLSAARTRVAWPCAARRERADPVRRRARAPPALRSAPLDEAGLLEYLGRGWHRQAPQAFAAGKRGLVRPKERMVVVAHALPPTPRRCRDRAPCRRVCGRRCAPPPPHPTIGREGSPSCQALALSGSGSAFQRASLGQARAARPSRTTASCCRPFDARTFSETSHSTPSTPHEPAISRETS